MTKIYALSLLAVTCFLNCFGQTVQFTSLTTGLSSPVDIVAAPDTTGRLFIVEKTGGIRIYANSSLQPGSFVDIAHRISGGGERGLLSMAFHPDYINNRYFFVL